jgi:hypothetical protein
MFCKMTLLSFVFLFNFAAYAQGHSSNNAVHIGDTQSGVHIPCETSKIPAIMKCSPPDGSQKVSTALTSKAVERIKRFCGSTTKLNCEFTCVGYLASPKDYGCADNFAGGPIASKNCLDKLIGLVPGAVEKLNELSDKCHQLATNRRNPQQSPVVDDTSNNNIGVGTEKPLAPGPIQVDE